MKGGEQTVAICFDMNFRHAAEIYNGLTHYVAESGSPWRLLPLNFGFEARLMELAASGELDGAIGTFVSDAWVAGLTDCGVAAVNLFHFSRIESIPSVCPDDRGLGRMAAEHFREQGAGRFAFFGADAVRHTRLRYSGFREATGGADCERLEPDARLAERLANWRTEKTPTGVFCASDGLARRFLTEAAKAGLQCGRDFLLAGVDNDPSASVFADVPLSSFRLPCFRIGRTAGGELHRLLDGGPVRGGATLVEGAEFIARESSLSSRASRIAQRAARMLTEHLDDPSIAVDGVAHAAGVSRRVLEMAFKKHFQCAPFAYLARLRFREAARLLRETSLPVMEVGGRCGYPEPHHFSSWFKNRSGCAPAVYRRLQSRASDPTVPAWTSRRNAP